MPNSSLLARPLIAVDIGNSRMKFGLFTHRSETSLAEPVSTLDLPSREWAPASLAHWVADIAGPRQWCVASVYRKGSALLADWIRTSQPDDFHTELTFADLGLAVTLPEPRRVGIDRLIGGVAANRLRARDQGAIVVDLGTAITVDCISPAGEFTGGAILPGIGMAARSLHEQTDALPLEAMRDLGEPPPVLGTSTLGAIRSGLYWGAVGAVRELVDRLSRSIAAPCEVLLTGGTAPSVAPLLGTTVRHVPHLILAGIALVAEKQHLNTGA